MPSWTKQSIVTLICTLILHMSVAGPLRDRIMERRAAQEQNDTLDDGADAPDSAALPSDVLVERDIAYGTDTRQRFDVYHPRNTKGAPVIFMVHGGGWRRGDKAARSVVENKVARWVPAGFILVSTNYRMLPDTGPVEQAKDVALALATAQNRIAAWGGDRSKFILMGHSAGAHLVALLAASPAISNDAGAGRWLGSVLLDSAALDVVQLMQERHMRLYDQAFDRDPQYWRAGSPFDALAGTAQPILAVCSTRRSASCAQADQFVAKAVALGTRASVLREDLSHREINVQLGEAGSYTQGVEAFLRSLDDSAAKALASHPAGAH